ncbi:MAG: coenzyme F420-0:L-glutamate ligase [Lapillicoccus sp.]
MTLTVIPVTGLPEVAAGDDLADLLLSALSRLGLTLADGDVLVVSSKVASKAAGLTAPDREAAIVAETVRVVAERRTDGRLTQVVESAAGPVMAAAGVDASNTGRSEHVLLLPHDPDAVCRALRAALTAGSGITRLGVVLSDTAGRPWRTGQVDFALGAAGIVVADDLRGGVDADGRELGVTVRALADEVASAADLVKGKADGVPVALVRGLDALVLDGAGDQPAGDVGARSLVRTGPGDWFALGHVEAVRAALGVEPGSVLASRFGVMDVAPEPPSVTVGRAVAVAVHDLERVGVDVGDDHVVVTGPDPVEVGMATARVAVALWGEGYDARVAPPAERTPESVRITFSRR